jgi:hypothetical protein
MWKPPTSTNLDLNDLLFVEKMLIKQQQHAEIRPGLTYRVCRHDRPLGPVARLC